MTDELRDIITGIRKIAERNLIQTALDFLRESERASGKIKSSKLINKEDEVSDLILFANQNRL
ncbi:hypothetical protein VB264_13545 [Arcicella aquatica]|uniref:Uncharacterized protein n=1 Tax=Arcicella aquatica TaxID=217141 RepID=A0ABU5QPI8_9BACT|nr:hypothetical protein [Arcicella aquatica]MEA5258815.1 hypothetical protein [Arcicella aquatica]